MKTCVKCYNEYEEALFYNRSKNRKRNECKYCWNEITKQNQLKIKLEMIQYKGGKCSNCGYNKHYSALEFHHIDPNKKEIEPAKATSFLRIKDELDKCILLCANCHREVHYR